MIRKIKLSTATWWKIITVSFFIVIILDAMKPALGHFEGMVWPVIENVKITDIVYDEDHGYIEFSGIYEKTRDCDIVRYEWFMTDPDGYNRERFDVFIFNDRWRNRQLGSRPFGPRRAYVDKDAFLSYVYAIAVHDCHPFYDTRTVFYKGKKVIE